MQIKLSDIQDEIDFRNYSIVFHIIGANPPIKVIEEFIRRIWKHYHVDKVVMVKKGMFIMRFATMDYRDQMLGDTFFFYSKPVIMKAWTPHIDIHK